MKACPLITTVTASAGGAVAVVQIVGTGAADLVEQFIGSHPTPSAQLVRFEDIDEGLSIALRDDWCQLMPHGGVRVMQRLIARLVELGGVFTGEPDASLIYPEASSQVEAEMLLALSHAASPAAVPLLLQQPRVWNSERVTRNAELSEEVLALSDQLDHLMTPPTVAVVGRANVGKSTLMNQLAGRSASIVADLPGTTRDWVGQLVLLPSPIGQIAVHWLDTPGLRSSDDAIEQRAIALAQRAIEQADVLVAMRDPTNDWPDEHQLPRTPDVWVMNKCDLATAQDTDQHVIRIAAATGKGMDALIAAITGSLGLADLPDPPQWAFSPRLRRQIQSTA